METIGTIFEILKTLSLTCFVFILSHTIYQLFVKDNPKLFEGRAWKWFSMLALVLTLALAVVFVGFCVIIIVIGIV